MSHCDAPLLDFTLLHEVIRYHISRGNNFAVLGTLALGVVYENPAFWRSCTYHDGIAVAVIASVIKSLEKVRHCRKQDVGADAACFLSKTDEHLTANELYVMLRRINGEDSLLQRVLGQLEAGAVLHSKSNNDESSNDVARSVSQSSEATVALDEVCAVLREHFCGDDVWRGRQSQASRPSASLSPKPLKHARESHSPFGRCVARVEDSGPAATTSVGCTDGPHDADKAVFTDALDVLAHMPAIPGSTRAVTSFEAVTDPAAHGGDVRVDCRGVVQGAGPHRKQRRHKFTPAEDEAILLGVARFSGGPGRFEKILYAYSGVWHPERTASQLRDHWRGTLRQQAVLQNGGYRGKNSVATRGEK